MTKAEILQDLRMQFGPVSVLYADQLAVILGKSVDATRILGSRDGWPVARKIVGGRPCVSIHAVASWLAGEDVGHSFPGKQSSKVICEHPPIPAPKRKVRSLEKMLMLLRTNRQFLEELDTEIERIIFAETSKINDGSGRPVSSSTTL